MSNPPFLPRPEVMELTTYNSGLTLGDVAARCGGGPIARLASNENAQPSCRSPPSGNAAMPRKIWRSFCASCAGSGRWARGERGAGAGRAIPKDGPAGVIGIRSGI